MKTLITTVILSLFILTGFSQLKNIRFDRLTTEDGLSQSQVNTITQDFQGFMWFGTVDGLNRYDGYNFKVYKPEVENHEGFQSNFILSLYEDKNKTLWVGTRGGLNYYDRDNDKFIHCYPDENDTLKLGNQYAMVITETHDGKLLIGTTKTGLLQYDRKTQKFSNWPDFDNTPEILIANNVLDIMEENDKILWLATNRGLVRFNRNINDFNIYTYNEDDPKTINHKICRTLDMDKNGTIWVGTNRGFNRMIQKGSPDNPEISFERFSHDDDNPNSFSDFGVFSALIDSEDRFWLGTWETGLDLYDKENKRFYNYQPELSNPYSITNKAVAGIYQDRSGIVWFATWGGGVCRYDRKKSKFKRYQPVANDENSLNNGYICSLLAKDSIIWIGTWGGGLNKYNSITEEYKHFMVDDDTELSLEHNAIYGLYMDNENRFWIGTRMGIKLFDPVNETFKEYPIGEEEKGISNRIVRAMFGDGDIIWIGTDEGLNKFNTNDGSFEYFMSDAHDSNTLSSNKIRNICKDDKGNLWVATANGLNRFNPETGVCKRYFNDPDDRNSLSYNYIWRVYFSKAGDLWIGTAGGGLNRFDSETEKFEVFTENDGLANDGIYGILEDEKGNLWISSNKGISKFNPETKTFENYDITDGLQANEFNGGSFSKSKSGEMFFGGINGFNSFFPSEVKKNTYKPNVVLSDFKILNKSVKIGEESPLKKDISQTDDIILTHKDYVISFDFASLHYSKPNEIQYRYQLVGFDKDWVYTDASRRFATYTNLDQGDYTLKVGGTNSDGIWSDKEIHLKIKVLPPYWKTWWFRGLVVIFIFGSISLWYWSRIKNIKRQNEILERKVKERTAEVVKKNKELEHQKAEIEKAYNQIEKQAADLKEINAELREKQEEIQQQTEELATQAEVLQQTNTALEREKEHTLGSIRYAKTIQSAILPSQSDINDYFSSFIIYRPKDIVSGDFYWFSVINKGKDNEKLFIAAVDCTGHGVPGAFMSMIGSRMFSEIINEKNIFNPKEIMEELDRGIKRALRQDETDNDDGMDVCLCRMEKNLENNMKIMFSGAKRPLFIFSSEQKEIITLKGDRRAIGGVKKRRNKVDFTQQEYIAKAGDILYLTTDGIMDQNDEDRKKFGTPKFLEKINEIGTKEINQQKQIIEAELDKHQGEEQQRDDITIIGLGIL